MPKRVETLQDSKSLQKIAERLQICAADLQAVAAMMVAQHLDTLKVPNFSSLTLGVRSVQSFANAAKLAVYAALEERGDYGAAKVSLSDLAESQPPRAHSKGK